MIKNLYILFFLLLSFATHMSGNDNKTFELSVPSKTTVVKNSLYNQILFLDDRSNYEFDRISIDHDSFSSLLSTLMSSLTDETANNGTLYLQLRNLNLDENKLAGKFSRLRITLYRKIGNKFYYIRMLDNKIPVEKVNLFEQITSDAINDFIASSLNVDSIDTEPYSFDEMRNIAYFEKENLVAYNAFLFTNGLYKSYKSFVDQEPDSPIAIAKIKKDELKEIKITDNNGKNRKISPNAVYAAVVDGKPYIAQENRFIRLNREDDEFIYEDEVKSSKIRFSPSVAFEIGSGGYRGGGIGLGFFTQTKRDKITYKIDHLTGDTVPL